MNSAPGTLPLDVPGFGTAFFAGILSFLSPCVLPLIPGYLSFLSGYGIGDIRAGRGRGRLLLRSLAFSAGFSLVFAALGLVFSGGALLLGGLSRTLSIVAGVTVALLGLNFIFDFAKFLNRETRIHPGSAPRSLAGAFGVGLVFGAGWSPCVGPILASILFLAAREGSALRAAVLLLAYSLGLALPFIATGVFLDRLSPLMNFFKQRARAIRLASGLLLILLGAAMALGRLGTVSALAARAGFALKEATVSAATAVRLIGAAFWLVLALFLAAPPLLRHRGGTTPRFVAAALCALMSALEATGLVSSAAILAQWLLFSGA